jgi:hypothetical protein
MLDAGGWLTSNGFKCLLGTTRAGNAEVLEILLSAATTATTAAFATTAAIATAVSGSSGSSILVVLQLS